MKIRPLFLLPLLLAPLWASIVPTAFAFTIFQETFDSCGGSPSSCAKAFSSNTGNNNILVAVCVAHNSGATPPTFTVSSVPSTTWTQQTSAVDSIGGSNYGVFIFTTATTGGATTITCTKTAGAPTTIFIQIYEITAGLEVEGTAAGTCHTGCGTSLTTSTSLTATSGDPLIAGADCSGNGCPGGGGWAAGTSYTLNGNVGDNSAGEYSVTKSGATNFPMTVGTAGTVWVEAGIWFHTSIPNIVVSTCSWFQLQCWFYPFLFYMVFLVVVLAVGAVGRVSTKGLTYMMFVSLAFSSGVQVMMGIQTLAFPLILTIIATVYAWRFR